MGGSDWQFKRTSLLWYRVNDCGKKKYFSAGTWPSLDVVPDAFDHVLVTDLKLAALVDEAG
jgi:hypothetical protein